MSLHGLARVLEVSPATLSPIENGRTGLTVSRLTRIADPLGLSVPQILDIVVTPAATPNQKPPAAAPRLPAPAAHRREFGPLEFDPVLSAALEEFPEPPAAPSVGGATARPTGAPPTLAGRADSPHPRRPGPCPITRSMTRSRRTQTVRNDEDDGQDPPPVVWQPTPAHRSSWVGQFLRWPQRERGQSFDGYDDLWRWSVDAFEDFWEAAWQFFDVPTSARAPPY